MKKFFRQRRSEEGITLVALVVTIIVLIILATVSINAVLGENGIIRKAQQTKELYEQSRIAEEEAMNQLLAEYENAMADEENSTGGDITTPDNRPLVSTLTDIQSDTVTAEDEKGNQVVVPGGFKIADDSGTTVQQGIVIEDSDGNQFVWIPVSNINGDGSNLIVLDDGSTTEITLGRYTFDTSTGEETIQQYASNYTETVTIESYYQELAIFRESNQVKDLTGTNATAKDLAGFINSVSTNKGYYLARYEASYSSGSTFGVGDDSSYYKPASKVSTAKSASSMSYTAGTLWNRITQGNASMASRQMYYGDSYVESDLCNSYAWDTAIVYIQKMGNSNYANANCNTTGNTSLLNTGETGDEVCKIYDMAANADEWTTEYSTRTDSDFARPCTCRGGNCTTSNGYTRFRSYPYATQYNGYRSFRPLLYM